MKKHLPILTSFVSSRKKSFSVWAALLSVAWTLCAASPINANENEKWAPVSGPLTTPWTEKVSPESVLPEYPRPQMVRDEWTNLNGLWDYAILPHEVKWPEDWQGKILVPFCIESSLSGVGKSVTPKERLWYRRTFELPELDGRKPLLHFGAVDWYAAVFLNGKLIGRHQGGYDPFTIDLSSVAKPGENELVVVVSDPTDTGEQPHGKQVLKPRGIMYTSITGIWQTVWLELVPKTHVRSLQIVPEVDASQLCVTVHGSDEASVRATVFAGEKKVAAVVGRTGRELKLPIADPRLWSPDDPYLYDLKVELLLDGKVVDTVDSYAGMRKIEMAPDSKGVLRMMLNGKPTFQYGPLDQGFWPDGLYTAPTDEALRFDIEMTKRFGFNMTRKHVKVEPARWYYWCDKLGLLVWQDMPSSRNPHPKWERDVDVAGPEGLRAAAAATDFNQELTELLVDFGNHPCIVVWVPFNERWGQCNTERTVEWIRRVDPTRLINSASGGNFLGVGDILDRHSYPDPALPRLDAYQAVVCGEFGGLGLPVEGHTWQEKANWGYRNYKTKEELKDAYKEKVSMCLPFIDQGLSAAVYTQLTDVEIEVNGLMTYDRRVNKLDPEETIEIAHKLMGRKKD